MLKTTIEFNDAASDELQRLSVELATTKAEVLRSALSLYLFLVDELKTEGRQLGILDDKKKLETVVVVPGLIRRPRERTIRAGA